MAFGWNHEGHKEEIFFSFVLSVSFVVPSLTSRSGEEALNVDPESKPSNTKSLDSMGSGPASDRHNNQFAGRPTTESYAKRQTKKMDTRHLA